MTVTIVAKRVTPSSRNPYRVRIYRFTENGEYTMTTEKVNDRETVRAMVETLAKANRRAKRMHIKYEI